VTSNSPDIGLNLSWIRSHGAQLRTTALVHAHTREVYMQTASTKESLSRATLVTRVLQHANFAMNQG
jgi:hypothetical protein